MPHSNPQSAIRNPQPETLNLYRPCSMPRPLFSHNVLPKASHASRVYFMLYPSEVANKVAQTSISVRVCVCECMLVCVAVFVPHVQHYKLLAALVPKIVFKAVLTAYIEKSVIFPLAHRRYCCSSCSCCCCCYLLALKSRQ